MPENKQVEQFKFIQSLGFVGAKQFFLTEAAMQGTKMSVRTAKGLAGQVMDCATADDYKRIIYSDPIGEGIAKRWQEFNHNECEQVAA